MRKESRGIWRGVSSLEVATALGIVTVLLGLSLPGVAAGRRSAHARSSLARLRSLHAALSIYRADWEGGEVWSGLPSYDTVYATHLGLGEETFRSPCGETILPNVARLGYQYSWERHPEIVAYFDALGERSVIFTDASCNPSRAIWDSPAALKRGLGVRLDGSLVDQRRRGTPIVLSWWGR